MSNEELYKLYKQHPIICTDTRKITPGCLFFALKGDTFDANEFAAKALELGAAFAIVDNPDYAKNENIILVENSLKALQDIATIQRDSLEIPVIGITGTNGKTTTKELIKSVLSQKYKTYATEGNLNNHIGVPLTLLSISEDFEIAIVEMGANHQGEIAFLSSLAKPHSGLITNIGKAHLEGFGGLQGVIKAKSELYDFIKLTAGTVFVNRDNPLLVSLVRDKEIQNRVYYGRDSENLVSGNIISSDPYLKVEWKYGGQNDKIHTVQSQLTGIYNFENLLAAICVGAFYELSPEQINAGIASYQPKNNRSQILKTANNQIICDYYNANPSSMLVAIENLNSMTGQNKWMILGDMFELGDDSADEHRMVLDYAKNSEGRKIFIGKEFFKLKNSEDLFFETTPDALNFLKDNLVQNATILLKGSRGMAMENILPLL